MSLLHSLTTRSRVSCRLTHRRQRTGTNRHDNRCQRMSALTELMVSRVSRTLQNPPRRANQCKQALEQAFVASIVNSCNSTCSVQGSPPSKLNVASSSLVARFDFSRRRHSAIAIQSARLKRLAEITQPERILRTSRSDGINRHGRTANSLPYPASFTSSRTTTAN